MMAQLERTVIGKVIEKPLIEHITLALPNLSMQYTENFFSSKKNKISLDNFCNVLYIFAHFIYFCSKHGLCDVVLTSFGSNIRKNVNPCIPHFCYVNVGCKGV